MEHHEKMTANSLLVFILLTNLWDDGYIGISYVAGIRNFVGRENQTLTVELNMPAYIDPVFVSLALDGFIFVSFPYKSTAAITPYPKYVSSTTITRVLGGFSSNPRRSFKIVFNPLKGIHAGTITCHDGLDGGDVIPACGNGAKITVIRRPDPPSVVALYGSSKVGDSLTLHCQSKSRSLPVDNPLDVVVQWANWNNRYTQLPGGDVGGLRLENISMADAGLRVKCRTLDKYTPNGDFLFSQWGPYYIISPYSKTQKGKCTDNPDLQSHVAHVQKEEGEMVEFFANLKTCGDLSWHRETMSNTLFNTHKYIIVTDTSGSKLAIKNLTQADSGFYICRAVNDYGTAVQFKYQLTVKPKPPPLGILKPILTLDDKDKKIIHGSNFTWTCGVQPQWNIDLFQWIYNGNNRNLHGVENYTDPGDTIDIGLYSARCRGRSGLDWTAHSNFLQFKVIPATPTLTSSVYNRYSQISIISPAPLTLSCYSVDAVPGIFYNFYENYKTDLGRYVPSFHTEAVTYTVPTLKAKRFILYTCIATINNLESLHSKEIGVTVKIRPKAPTLLSSVEDSVITVNTSLTFECSSLENERQGAANNKTTYYMFYRDGQILSNNSKISRKKYEVPTSHPAPQSVYTCTASWVDIYDVVESLHSSPRPLTIVGDLNIPILTLPHTMIDGQRFTMECTSNDPTATSYRFTYGSVNYDTPIVAYDVDNPSVGKQNASCQYFIGKVGSPHSDQCEVNVRPKTPTLTPNIEGVVVSIDESLTLTCETKSSKVNTAKSYKFYKEKIQISADLVKNTYKIPTNNRAPLHGYTCTVTMETIESFHSLTYVVEIVVLKKPSVTVSNKTVIHGGNFKINCSVEHKDVVKFQYYYQDGYPPVDYLSKSLTINRPDIGKYEAKCRFYSADGSRSPFSNVVEVKVLPKTPTLSASLPDKYIRVNETLTLTCRTLSIGPNPTNYSFYSDNNLVPGSPSSNNTYQVPTNEAFSEVVYTCTVNIASVESLHSSQHIVTVYEPSSTDIGMIAILVIIGFLLFVCSLTYLFLRKKRKKDQVELLSVQEFLVDSVNHKNVLKNGTQSLPNRSTQGTGLDIDSRKVLEEGSAVDPEDWSAYSGGTYGVISDKPSGAPKKEIEKSHWHGLRGIFTPDEDKNSKHSGGESTMNYFKSLDGWQSERAGTDIDEATESLYDPARRESDWQRLKLQHLRAFVEGRDIEDSLHQQSLQESSLQRPLPDSQGKKQQQAGDKETDSKKVVESCWQRCVPRCLRKKSKTAGPDPKPVKFELPGPNTGKSNSSSDQGTSVDFPSYSGTAQTKQTKATTDNKMLQMGRPTDIQTLRSGQTTLTKAPTDISRNTNETGRSVHGLEVD